MDIEFYQYEDQVFHPNLICWSNAEEEEIYHAENVEDYLEPFEELMMVEDDERERKVVSFSYNLRGIEVISSSKNCTIKVRLWKRLFSIQNLFWLTH